MTESDEATRSWFRPVAGVAVLAVAVGLWWGLRDDGPEGPDPVGDVVSDEDVPEMTATVRDDDGQSVVDIAYDQPDGRVPDRATHVFLQTRDDGIWSTAYTMSEHPLDQDQDHVIEGWAEAYPADAAVGPGPDTYPLPDLESGVAYRLCVEFTVGRPVTDAIGCSVEFSAG